MSKEEDDLELVAPRQALEEFSDSVASLWCPAVVPIIEQDLSSLEFCRDFVSKSRPCILRNTIMGGAKLPRWTVEDIQQLCGDDLEITVNVTPDGHGDAIRTISTVEDCCNNKEDPTFVLPEERRMSMSDFVTALRSTPVDHATTAEVDSNGLPILQAMTEDGASKLSIIDNPNSVYYYSMQNDCLRSEFAALLPELSSSASPLLEWAEASFGTGPPDALNIWMGNERAHSSLHKDHYENLFYVASGRKLFTIYPPADAAILPVISLPTSRFECTDGTTTTTWCVVPADDDDDGAAARTPWIDFSKAATAVAPLQYLHPISVHVEAGDILYLPSLWFHAVTQTCETVGINWWFDMHFDSPLYCYFQLLESCKLVQRAAAAIEEEDE